MAKQNLAGLKWKWSKGIKPTERSLSETMESMRNTTIEENGRLLTEEEAIQITDEIRDELREKEL